MYPAVIIHTLITGRGVCVWGGGGGGHAKEAGGKLCDEVATLLLWAKFICTYR